MRTCEEAFWVIERLEPELSKVGVHCALAGSVAYRGWSEKDLDLIIYPHTVEIAINETKIPFNFKPAKDVIQKFFEADDADVWDCEDGSQIRDGKQVSCLKTPKGKRVDCFFLQ